jgi:putative ABC transport system substrate-binding protein
VRAQEGAVPVIGYFNSATPDGFSGYLPALRQGLKEGGYVEGENVVIEYRWAENQPERLPELAADLVRRQVKVIAAMGAPASIAAG